MVLGKNWLYIPVESVTKSWIDRQLSRIYKCLQRCNQQQNTTIKNKIGHIKVIKQALTKKNSTRVYIGISRMKVFHFISRLFKKYIIFHCNIFKLHIWNKRDCNICLRILPHKKSYV